MLVVAARRSSASFVSRSTEIYFITALVSVSIVVALYVFVGNSGVLSFGHISFVAVGAWAAGVLSVPVEREAGDMPYLFDFLARHDGRERAVAPDRGRRRAASSRSLVGLPLMRLSGLAAGIATFAVLGITNNILRYYEKIGPGLNTFSSVPETTDLLQAAVGAVLVIVAAFALPAEPASGGSCARRARIPRPRARSASRSTASGSSRSRSRGSSPGFAGGLYIHFSRSTSTRSIST